MNVIAITLDIVVPVSWGISMFYCIRDTHRLEKRMSVMENRHVGTTDDHVISDK